jgi:hypothetical protein
LHCCFRKRAGHQNGPFFCFSFVRTKMHVLFAPIQPARYRLSTKTACVSRGTGKRTIEHSSATVWQCYRCSIAAVPSTVPAQDTQKRC